MYRSCSDRCVDELLLDLGVVAGGASRSLFEPLVLLVAAIVLLDEDGRAPALLETLLLVVGPELGLDQDGRLSHLLVERVLRRQSHAVSVYTRPNTTGRDLGTICVEEPLRKAGRIRERSARSLVGERSYRTSESYLGLTSTAFMNDTQCALHGQKNVDANQRKGNHTDSRRHLMVTQVDFSNKTHICVRTSSLSPL